MTDYAQYFLGLSAAPTAIIQRNPIVSSPMVSYTENGVTDYTFHSREENAWLDLVSKEFTTDAEAELSIGGAYNEETGKITVDYVLTSALDVNNANIGLLCIVTEDGLAGFQSNAFYTTTDTDLGEWQKGGSYAKSTVYPYIFNDVARALYPANAYNGQTGLIPTTLRANEQYAGTITLDLAMDAPFVKNVNNCKLTLIALDANTGKVINAARVKMGEYMTSIDNMLTSPNSTKANIYDLHGRTLKRITSPGLYIINNKKVYVK